MNVTTRSNMFITIILFVTVLKMFAQESVDDNKKEYLSMLPAKSLLEKISIDLKEVSFEKALSIISSKGNFNFNYNRSRIPAEQKVSVKMNQTAIINILFKILNDTKTALKITNDGYLAIVPSAKPQGEIAGRITEELSGESLAGANIVISGTTWGASSSKDGRFLISKLPMGVYTIEASMIGFKSKQIQNIIVTDNALINTDIELEEILLPLRAIVVTPGHFSLMETESVTSMGLKAEDIRSFPQIGEDIYRAINRLPGVTGNDVSAKFNIRGGEYEETLVLLDGMELYDPFHLKDLDGFFSIIDVEAIRSIDMMTGAFPVQYYNHLSGVFDMQTVNPTRENAKTSLSLSFLNARLLNQGSSVNGKLQWLLLARRGYLDLLLKWLNPDDKISPVYYDLFSKFQYTFNSKNVLTAYFLAAEDDIKLTETDDGLVFDTNYGNLYGWLNWHAQFQTHLNTQTVLSYGRVLNRGHAHQTPLPDAEFNGEVRVKRAFDFFGIKQDWVYELSGDMLFKWGFNIKNFHADYDFYFREPVTVDYQNGNEIYDYTTTIYTDDPTGNEIGLYFSDKYRISPPLTLELGLRYDQVSWTKDKNISPRINMVYDLSKKTALRLGWGRFYQSQGIHKLNTLDGDKKYYHAELAEHSVVGIEHETKSGMNFRIELYQKKISNTRPRYHNFRGFTLNPIGEIHDDRIRVEPQSAECRGLEIYFKNDSKDNFNWWFSYSYAIAEDVVDGMMIPRDFDQRHTVYADMTYRLNKNWHFNLAWQYHSGWPYTKSILNVTQEFPGGYIDYEWLPGPLNAGRLPDYHRMDIRATRVFYTSHGRISTFIEIRNIYNRENIREYIYEYAGIQNGKYVANRTGAETLLPLLPSFGISWEF